MSTTKFVFPDPRPEDDASFRVGKGEHVVGRCVGHELNQTKNGKDVIRLAFKVEPGEKDEHGKDVGGQIVLMDGNLSGGGLDITLDALRRCGWTGDGLPAQERLIAIADNDVVASGCGKNLVRLVVFDDTFTPEGKDPITRIRCKYVNAIPVKGDAEKAKSLAARLFAGGAGAPGAGGSKKTEGTGKAGATSAPPAVNRNGEGGAGGDDEIPF